MKKVIFMAILGMVILAWVAGGWAIVMAVKGEPITHYQPCRNRLPNGQCGDYLGIYQQGLVPLPPLNPTKE